MKTKAYLNNEPFKEEVCKDCGKMLRQTRVGHGLKMYRVWVHKDTRRTECGNKEDDVIDWSPKRPMNHTERCVCPDCEHFREDTGV